MSLQVLIGTTNPSKLRMFEEWLGEYPVRFVTLADLGITDEPVEAGNTPVENARLKAEYYGEKPSFVEVIEIASTYLARYALAACIIMFCKAGCSSRRSA